MVVSLINIILIEYPGFQPIFYVMKKKDNNYIMEDISYQEVADYMKEYDSLYGNYFEMILRKCNRK